MRFKSFFTIMVIMMVAMMATGCKNGIVNQVPEPEDQKLKKLHEDPTTAEFILQECHTHGPTTWHGNGVSDQVKYFKTYQKITYKLKKGKDGNGRPTLEWGPAEDSPKAFYVRTGLDYGESLSKPGNGGNFYSLVIKYYNAKGEDITYQFVTKGQENIHQHFFIPVDNSIKTWDATDKEELMTNLPKDENGVTDLFKYWYMDTDPHDKLASDDEAKFIKDPRGFKGILQFNPFKPVAEGVVPETYSCDIQVKLMHSLTNKKDPKKTFSKTETPSPYNKPSTAQLQVDVWDLDTKIHFVVFSSRMEYLMDESMKTFADLKTDEQRDYVRRYAKAWGCTPDQAVVDILGQLSGSTLHVSSNL